jgi:hypothetical protein
MTQRIASLFLFAGLLLLSGGLRAQDYRATMAKRVQNGLSKQQFRHYEWIPYPTNDFGLATMFIVEKKGQRPKAQNEWCAGFKCLGVKPGDVNKLTAEEVKTARGFAEIGDGGPINFTDDEKKSLTLSAVLPKIVAILDLSGNVDRITGVNATIALGAATVRFLAKDKALTYITRLPDNSKIHKAYSNGTLCIVVSDVMVDSMDIVLKIDKKLNAGFDANLRRKVNQVFGDGDKLQVKVGRNDNGFYFLRITKPVIVARLIASQAFGAGRGADFKGHLGKWNDGWISIALAEEESQPEN